MIQTSIFEKVGALVSVAKARELADYDRFLKFYREIVEALPSDAIKAFGGYSVKVLMKDGKQNDWSIELTVADYIWWKVRLEEEGVRFVTSPVRVQTGMLNQLSKKAELSTLEPKERKELLALLDESREPSK